MEYDDWQLDVLKAEGNVLLNKGRQIGGTEIFAHKAAEFIINNPKEQIICVSDTLEQAENIIIMVLAYLQEHYPTSILKGKHKPTKGRVWVKGEGHIRSRPVGETGDAIRSFTGKILYVDEASKMNRAFWTAAKAIKFTRAGSAIWMSSTPRGKFDANRKPTYYYKSYLNENKRFTVIEMDSETVAYNRRICPTWTIEQRANAIQHLKDEKADMTDAEYSQEYLGEFMDDMTQWFSDKLIEACMTLRRPDSLVKGKDYYLGVDVARMGEDESTFCIFEDRDDGIYQVESQITTKTTLPQTFEHIKQLNRLYEFSKIFIDSEGIGVGVFDWLMQDDETKSITEAIYNSEQIISKDGKTKKLKKNLKYSHFKMLMETGRVHLLTDAKIFESLKSVQYAYTNDNLGVRHLKIFGNYTHLAEGCTNAVWGYKYKHLNLSVYSIKV